MWVLQEYRFYLIIAVIALAGIIALFFTTRQQQGYTDFATEFTSRYAQVQSIGAENNSIRDVLTADGINLLWTTGNNLFGRTLLGEADDILLIQADAMEDELPDPEDIPNGRFTISLVTGGTMTNHYPSIAVGEIEATDTMVEKGWTLLNDGALVYTFEDEVTANQIAVRYFPEGFITGSRIFMPVLNTPNAQAQSQVLFTYFTTGVMPSGASGGLPNLMANELCENSAGCQCSETSFLIASGQICDSSLTIPEVTNGLVCSEPECLCTHTGLNIFAGQLCGQALLTLNHSDICTQEECVCTPTTAVISIGQTCEDPSLSGVLTQGQICEEVGGCQCWINETTTSISNNQICSQYAILADSCFQVAGNNLERYIRTNPGCETTELVIPPIIAGETITQVTLSEGVLSDIEDLTYVSIPNTTQYIEGFQNANIQTLHFAAGSQLNAIGNNAFENNNISQLIFNSPNLGYLGDRAFANNALSSVTFPPIVSFNTTVSSEVFNNNNLTQIHIPSSITYVGERAFANNNLQSVTISSTGISNSPISTVRLENEAFYNNINLSQFVVNPGGETLNPRTVDIGERILGADTPKSAILDLVLTDRMSLGGTQETFKNAGLRSLVIEPGHLTTAFTFETFMDNHLEGNLVIPELDFIGTNVFANNNLTSLEILASTPFAISDGFAGNPITQIDIPNVDTFNMNEGIFSYLDPDTMVDFNLISTIDQFSYEILLEDARGNTNFNINLIY